MSKSPESTAGAANDSGYASGFKSFWRKSSRSTKSDPLTFVQQHPASKTKTNRISRLLKKGSPTSSKDDGEDPTQGSPQTRRQQVYNAQKRHRNRKAEYVQTLEAEVARLQALDARINSEKNEIAHQNNAMREFLASQSPDVQLESIDLSAYNLSSEDLSLLGGAAVDIRFDPEIGHDRTFLDLLDMEMSDMVWTSDETSADERQPKRPARHAPVAGDAWAALDFILALEWPCKEHIKHHTINPDAQVPEACAVGKFHGHALTATAAVYQSSLPPASPARGGYLQSGDSSSKDDAPNRTNWQLPHSEIDKLVELSEMLELDDESMTPAQAYSAIRETVPNDSYLRPMLEALKKPLSSLVHCQGFGACMDSAMFWEHVDGTLRTLQFTRPELG